MRVLMFSATTGYQLRSFVEAAGRAGVDLLFATDRCHALDDPWQDAAVPVRFHDEASSLRAIVAATAARPVDGILVVGDRPVVLAALTAERLGLPGHPPEAARASGNKHLARARFAAAGLPAPWYFTAPVSADPRALAAQARYPAVVKPLGLSGSRGVIRVDDEAAFLAAWARVGALLARREIRALRQGLEGEILVEGFVEGAEYAVEGVLTAGEFQPFAIFDKPDPLDGPYFEETLYVAPSSLSAPVQARLCDTVARGAAALGLRHGAVHAECRVGPAGIVLLEIAARPIGGLCSRVVRFTGGARSEGERLTLEDVLLRHAVGADVRTLRREPDGAAVMMIPIPRGGVFKGVEGEQEARSVPGVEDVRITAKVDQVLEPLPEAGSYLGFIFGRGATAGDAERSVRAAHERLHFRIAPALTVTPA